MGLQLYNARVAVNYHLSLLPVIAALLQKLPNTTHVNCRRQADDIKELIVCFATCEIDSQRKSVGFFKCIATPIWTCTDSNIVLPYAAAKISELP